MLQYLTVHLLDMLLESRALMQLSVILMCSHGCLISIAAKCLPEPITAGSKQACMEDLLSCRTSI